MNITNNNNLPEPIVNAIKNHNHIGGDYSASMLYQSPRMVQLKKRNKNKITKDASEMVWALFGTALHNIVEKGAGKNDMSEQYLSTEILGKSLTGTADLLTENNDGTYTITDYKTLSVWSIIYMSSVEEWEKQLNTYAFLFTKAGFNISKIQIVGLMRDWQKSKAITENYPKSQIQVIDVKLWNEIDQETYIIERISLFESHNETDSNNLPYCTKKELWQDSDKFAIMKEGRKSAVRLLDSQEKAEQFIIDNELNDKHYINVRIAKPKRCDYCDGKDFCNQYKDINND